MQSPDYGLCSVYTKLYVILRETFQDIEEIVPTFISNITKN